jgi:ATP-dependent helicase HrpB
LPLTTSTRADVPGSLPIDAHLQLIRDTLRVRQALVVVAPPGAGKTTRVAPALAQDGPLILLQPRRVAARSIARRIALEQGLTLGEQVGWQVRFERQFGARTRLLVATEGILTARLVADPLLSEFRTIVLDEFHERSVHADMALALARQALKARADLRLVVMSATLETAPLAGFLGDCPVIDVPGRLHRVEVRYAPGTAPAAAVRAALARDAGHVLCFLPGAGEIRRLQAELESSPLPPGVCVRPLYGALDGEAQDLALAPSAARKVILATNIAETSLTVEGVSDVIDLGLHKVLRFDAERGIDRLETERIARDSAEQRAGRAGRTGPGQVTRLWDERERLHAAREPEIARVDLAPAVLDIIAWGGDPERFEWFEAPPPERVGAALDLLRRLDVVAGRRLTSRGELVRRLPLHPRLACVLVSAGGGARAAAACALLSERPLPREDETTTSCDLFPQIDRIERAPASVRRVAREMADLARRALGTGGVDDSDESLLMALLAGYPDRVAQRRGAGSARLLLASGRGAELARESGVRDGEYLAALDVSAGPRASGAQALVRQASLVRREWLTPTASERIHAFDPATQGVRAIEQLRYGALVLAERPVAADPEATAEILMRELRGRVLDERTRAFLQRAARAAVALEPEGLLWAACRGVACLREVDVIAQVPGDVTRVVERLCPEAIPVPSGRRARLEYRDDGSVHLAIKLQELFGLAESPRVGAGQEPVVIDLLSPSGRPVQSTRDLHSFWERTYPLVRKELRGRYPKHPWPEDPWTATPTARTQRGPRR